MKCYYMMLRLVCCECNCIKPFFFEISNSHRCIRLIVTPCFRHVSSNKRTCGYFKKRVQKQTLQTILYTVQRMFLLTEYFNMRMWPACLPYMNRGSFYLWGTLTDKIYKMNSKNHCTKDNIREKEVKKVSKCRVYHFTSITLMWMNN